VNDALKWKLIAGFVLVFLAGGVTGGFVAATTTRHYLFATSHHGVAAQRMRERLRTELNLTPDQVAKISPVLDKAATQLEQIRNDSARRVRETFANTHQQIAKDLTPEQRDRLEQLHKRHHRFMRHFHHGDSRAPDSPEP
jgi:Spy/CpxP family protein refolding chaperone